MSAGCTHVNKVLLITSVSFSAGVSFASDAVVLLIEDGNSSHFETDLKE